jgi:hypothetical protein
MDRIMRITFGLLAGVVAGGVLIGLIKVGQWVFDL